MYEYKNSNLIQYLDIYTKLCFLEIQVGLIQKNKVLLLELAIELTYHSNLVGELTLLL